jgi:hypothetical protein
VSGGNTGGRMRKLAGQGKLAPGLLMWWAGFVTPSLPGAPLTFQPAGSRHLKITTAGPGLSLSVAGDQPSSVGLAMQVDGPEVVWVAD